MVVFSRANTIKISFFYLFGIYEVRRSIAPFTLVSRRNVSLQGLVTYPARVEELFFDW